MARTAAILLLFGLLSCATDPYAFREVDAGVYSGSFDRALSAMEQGNVRHSVYPQSNSVLYYLDRGIIQHYAGLWTESSADLEECERLIEAAFTKSISQEIGSYIINDNVRDYPGEDYEDIYLNVFNALNYYHRGDLEGALVEIRRVNEKLRFLEGKYEGARKKVIDSNSELGSREYAAEAVQFSNSALARYLSLLFFRGEGDYGNARVDLEQFYRAYELAPAVYDHAPPSFLEDELEIPAGKARLNALIFLGMAPIKEETNLAIPLPLPAPNNWARLALPKLVDRPSAIRSVEIVLDNGRRVAPELVEDISGVVRETFKARYGLIVLKTVARTIAKSVTSAAFAAVMDNDDSGWGPLAGLIGAVAVNLSESADLRVARYLPGSVYAGGINLDPGVYSITVNYYGRNGLLASEEQCDVEVRSGRLNLVEFVCLK